MEVVIVRRGNAGGEVAEGSLASGRLKEQDHLGGRPVRDWCKGLRRGKAIESPS